MTIYIGLDEQQFRDLVAGRQVDIPGRGTGKDATPGVSLILSDIGWEAMVRAIAVAQGEQARRREPR